MSFPSKATPPNPTRAEFADPALLLVPALHAPSAQEDPASHVATADCIALFASQKNSCNVPFALQTSVPVETAPPVAFTNPFCNGLFPPSLSVQVWPASESSVADVHSGSPGQLELRCMSKTFPLRVHVPVNDIPVGIKTFNCVAPFGTLKISSGHAGSETNGMLLDAGAFGGLAWTYVPASLVKTPAK